MVDNELITKVRTRNVKSILSNVFTSSGGGGGTWGSITGTLSSQTDLQAALDAKADDLTNGNGTTANGSAVDLGGNLNANTQISGPSYTFSFGNEDASPLASFSAAGGIDTTSGVARVFLNELYSQLSFEKIYGSTYMNVKQRLGQNFDTVPEYGYAISFKRGGDTEVIALRITPQDLAGTPRTWELNLGSDATGDQYTRDASGYFIRKGITSTASTATLTIDSDNTYLSIVTAQAEAIIIANPTGTPFTGQELSISLKDNGVSRAISFGNQYVEFETFPTATTAGKRMYLGFIYNGTGWDYMGSRTQL